MLHVQNLMSGVRHLSLILLFLVSLGTLQTAAGQQPASPSEPKGRGSSLVSQERKPPAPPTTKLGSNPPPTAPTILAARPSPGYQGIWFDSWLQYPSVDFKMGSGGELLAREVDSNRQKDSGGSPLTSQTPELPRPKLKFESGEVLSLSAAGKVVARWTTVLQGSAGPGSPTNFVLFTRAAAYRFVKGKPPQHLLSVAGPVHWVWAPSWSSGGQLSCPTVWLRRTTGHPIADAVGAADLCGERASVRVDTNLKEEISTIPLDVFPLREHWGWINDKTFVFPSGAKSYTTIEVTSNQFVIETHERDEFLVQLKLDKELAVAEWSRTGFHRIDRHTGKEHPLMSQVLSRELTEVAFLNQGRHLAMGHSGYDWSCRTGKALERSRPFAVVVDLESGELHFKQASKSSREGTAPQHGDFRPAADASGLEVLEPGSLTKVWKPWVDDQLREQPVEVGWYCSPDKALLRIDGEELKVSASNGGKVARWDKSKYGITSEAQFSRGKVLSVATSRDNRCIGVLDTEGKLGVYDAQLSKPPRLLPPLSVPPRRAEIALDDSCKIMAVAQGDSVQLFQIDSGESVLLHLLELEGKLELAVRHSRGWADLGVLGRQATFMLAGGPATDAALTPLQFPHLLESFVQRARHPGQK